MNPKDAWAVCPRIATDGSSREPRLYETLRQANRFLNSEREFGSVELEAEAAGVTIAEIRKRRRERARERKARRAVISEKIKAGELSPLAVPAELSVVRNRSCGWEDPVPIRRIANGSICGGRPFREFLPIDALGPLPAHSLRDIIEKVVENRIIDFTCFLHDEWKFDAIEHDSRKRIGHIYEGRKHTSISEIVTRAIYDIEISLAGFHKNLACAAIADFFQSWQVWNHIADFCYRVGKSNAASSIVGNSFDAIRESRLVCDFVCEQMAVYAHEIFPLEQSTEGPPLGSSSRKELRKSYFASFPEKIVVLDVCWAAKQRYREWIRWIGGKLKDGSKADRAFRAVLTSGKRPEHYRPDVTRPKGWK